jgi:hypothetical protein
MGSRRADGRDPGTIDIEAITAIRGGRQWPKPPGPPRVHGPTPRADALIKVFIQPDSHHPYHDKRALELILRVLEWTKPEIGLVLGDHWDFFAISDHRKDPNRRLDLESEIASGNATLLDYERLGIFKRKIICEGNHEWRLQRYIADKASEVYRALAPAGLLQTRSLPESLNLKARGWEWVPYMDYGRIGDLYFTHDVQKAGKTAHESAQADFGRSSVIGHTHQMRLMIRGDVLGQIHSGAMFGWLGDWRAIDYKHRMKIRAEWPLGFGMAYIEKVSGAVWINPIYIATDRRRYRASVEGRLFSA